MRQIFVPVFHLFFPCSSWKHTKQKPNATAITWVPTAYFAMGLPFVVLNMVTVLMFSGLGVDDKFFTFWTSLILLPYTLKPLWSPFLELFRTKKFWVVTTQFLTGVTFWHSGILAGLAEFLRDCHYTPRNHRFQRSHPRHRLWWCLYEWIEREAAGRIHRLARCFLQYC